MASSLYSYKKVVKIFFLLCSWTHPTFKFSQALIKYLFGWGRLRQVWALLKALWDCPPSIYCYMSLYSRVCHSRAGGISKQNFSFCQFIRLALAKHATYKSDCNVVFFSPKGGWATTIIHSKKTQASVKLFPQHRDRFL